MPVRARSRASSSTRNAPQLVVDRAQLVELGVVAVGDDAAVAHHAPRARARSRARAARAHCGVERERSRARRDERRVERRRARRAARAARASVSRRPARSRGRALRKRDARRRCARRRPCARSASRQRAPRARRRRATRRCASCRADSARRDRAADGAASARSSRLPTRGRAVVEQREQRRRRLAAQRLGDLEIAPRRGIERDERARRARRRASRTCASAACCVAPAYSSSAPAAPIASGASSAPNAGEVERAELLGTARCAAAPRSNCHAGSAARRRRAPRSAGALACLRRSAARPASMRSSIGRRFGGGTSVSVKRARSEVQPRDAGALARAVRTRRAGSRAWRRADPRRSACPA